MHADAAMGPGNDQHRDLERAEQRYEYPEGGKHLRILLGNPVEHECEARVGEMVRQQRRHGEPEHELRTLGPAPAKEAPLVEREDPEPAMEEECTIEQERADYALPEPELDREHRLHSAEADIAERVIGEVQCHVKKKDRAGGEAKPPRPWTGRIDGRTCVGVLRRFLRRPHRIPSRGPAC